MLNYDKGHHMVYTVEHNHQVHQCGAEYTVK